jgi:hypothetical protein
MSLAWVMFDTDRFLMLDDLADNGVEFEGTNDGRYSYVDSGT